MFFVHGWLLPQLPLAIDEDFPGLGEQILWFDDLTRLIAPLG